MLKFARLARPTSLCSRYRNSELMDGGVMGMVTLCESSLLLMLLWWPIIVEGGDQGSEVGEGVIVLRAGVVCVSVVAMEGA